MNKFLPIYPITEIKNSQNTKLLPDSFSAINYPYGNGLMPSNQNNRNALPGTAEFGDGINYTEYIPKLIEPINDLGPKNTKSVNLLDQYFFIGQKNPSGSSLMDGFVSNGNIDLQGPRPKEPTTDYYIQLASKSLNAKADQLLSVFFSDSNLNHLRDTVVKKVKEITAESQVGGSSDGITIQTPNMDDFFYYLVNIYQNYKIHNGSIVFVNLRNTSDIKSEIIKLNTDALQEYISKMISQINMYIYYYRDASQLPEQLSVPTYTTMKGSRSLEYNTGYTPGNSIGVASYNEVGNII